MKHNEQYQLLQDHYLQYRDDKSLAGMLLIISEISNHLTSKYKRKNKLSISREDAEDITCKVILRVLTRYKTNPTWHVKKNIMGSLYFDWFKVITQSQNIEDIQQRYEDGMDSLDYINDGYKDE